MLAPRPAGTPPGTRPATIRHAVASTDTDYAGLTSEDIAVQITYPPAESPDTSIFLPLLRR